jgi:hypothetical protein
MSTTRYKDAATCPACGYKLDCAANADLRSATPELGDVTICGHCTEVLIFDVPPALHPASLAELTSLPERVRENIGAAQDIIRTHRPFGTPK